MKRIIAASLLCLSLAACGNAGSPAAQTAEKTPKLTEQLETLTGDNLWAVNLAESHVRFETDYNGKFVGGFQDFAAQIRLDLDAPETGEIYAVVDLASVKTRDRDVNSNLPTKAWFDTKNHPYAKFTSTDISAIGGQNYRADGNLTLKGVTQPAQLTFSLDVNGDMATANGGFEISRKDFGVGNSPDFQTDDWVKFPVKIMVKISASAQ